MPGSTRSKIISTADFAENGQNRAKTWLFVHEKFNNLAPDGFLILKIGSDQGEMVLYEHSKRGRGAHYVIDNNLEPSF